MTAISLAAMKGNVHVISVLLQFHANVNTQDKDWVSFSLYYHVSLLNKEIVLRCGLLIALLSQSFAGLDT